MTPVKINCQNKDVYGMIDWCNKQFNSDWDWASQFPSYWYTFTLPTPEAASWFLMQWQ